MNLAQLKRRIKYGPHLSRQMRAEFLLTQVDGPRRALTADTLAKIRAEVGRLAGSTHPAVRKFIKAMKRRYQELAL